MGKCRIRHSASGAGSWSISGVGLLWVCCKPVMNELPYWVQYVQALGPTVVAVIAALIAGYIAWRQWRTAHGQWRTAHDKLSFDLYEKRFAVYEATESFLTTAIVVGRITEEDCKALFK